MKTLSEMLYESRITASCKIDWSKKELLGELQGNETFEQIIELINNALDKFKSTFIDEKGFYMLMCANKNSPNSLKLLYIGLAYKQSLTIRLGQISGHQTAYECVIQRSIGKKLYVKLGILKECSLDKKTEQLYDDIEKCLTYCNQPTCNTQNRNSYASKRTIHIQNTGNYIPLNEKSNCSENKTCS